MASWVLSLATGDAGEVGVAVETPRGPVVESLMERGFAVHSINPKQLDRFRDRLSPAGAKDDRRDARVLASALRTDPHCLRRLEPTDPAIVELREWSRLSEELTRERVRLANRMRDQLWRYYPQFLDAVDDDVAAPWALDLWQSLPTPRAGQRVREVNADQGVETAPHPPDRYRDAARSAAGPGHQADAGRGRSRRHACTARRRTPRPGQPPARARAPRARRVGASARPGCSDTRPERGHRGRDIVDKTARCGHPAVAARHRQQGARHAACRGQRRGAATGLRRTSLSLRGGSSHPPFG